MEKKQTAIDLLQQQYYESEGKLTRHDFEQSKQMEREQIINAFSEATRMIDINDELSSRFNACLYYVQTYGGKS